MSKSTQFSNKVYLTTLSILVAGVVLFFDHILTKSSYAPWSVIYADVTGDSIKDIVVKSGNNRPYIFVAHAGQNGPNFVRLDYDICSKRTQLDYDSLKAVSTLKAQYQARRDSLEKSVQEIKKRARELK